MTHAVDDAHGLRPDGDQPDPDQPDAPAPLDTPRDGVPDVITTPAALAAAVSALAAGTGPVAVDAERASGYRYGQRAFLVQLRRAGAGTMMIDPVELPDLTPVGVVLRDVEWVLHAANQDLPCLAEVGMRPTRLFDTELAARLAGLPKVGLAAVVEDRLGLALAKEHSAADWSTRPLPESWLRYAALDVEVLVELRDSLDELLADQGKTEWARQEFAAIVAAPPVEPRVDPWRRTSGLHRVRSRRQLAAVRELWTAREAVARERDVSPGRLLPDSSVVEAAVAQPRSRGDLATLKGFVGRGARRHLGRWWDALADAAALSERELPPQNLPNDGPPPARLWSERDPAAAARLAAARTAIAELSTTHGTPVENLLTPDTVRRLAWQPPADPSPATVSPVLVGAGARPWQVDLLAPVLAQAMHAQPPDEPPPEAEEAKVTDE